MSGGLSHETCAILRTSHGKQKPLFSNMIAAELFEFANTLGPRKVLPRTDGLFIVYDERLPVGARTESTHDTAADAARALFARDR